MDVLTECHFCIPDGVRVRSLEGIRSSRLELELLCPACGHRDSNLTPLQEYPRLLTAEDPLQLCKLAILNVYKVTLGILFH